MNIKKHSTLRVFYYGTSKVNEREIYDDVGNNSNL